MRTDTGDQIQTMDHTRIMESLSDIADTSDKQKRVICER